MTPQLPDAAAYAPIFAALGDGTRLWLVTTLAQGQPQSISQLTRAAGPTSPTRQAMTKHLHVLEQVGLVEGVRVGRESRYRLKPERFADLHSFLNEVSQQWDRALARLEQFLEK